MFKVNLLVKINVREAELDLVGIHKWELLRPMLWSLHPDNLGAGRDGGGGGQETLGILQSLKARRLR